MALGPNETMMGGFVVTTTDRKLVVTNATAGATFKSGFLRDADGRLVTTNG